MPPKQRARDAARRRTGLVLERLESRELLTVIVHHDGHAAPRPAQGSIQAAAVQAGGGGSGGGVSAGSTALPSNQNPAVMNPTPAEAAKQKFVGGFVGTFQTNRGRFANEPLQALVLATGGATQSLHLTVQMQFFTYAIPGAVPTGQIVLMPRNTATTGTQLVLDLTSDGVSFAHGLPTHFNWTVDASSGGLYSNAVGSGTLDISYEYGRAPVGVVGGGRAQLRVNGTVVTGHGISLNISMPGNRTNNS